MTKQNLNKIITIINEEINMLDENIEQPSIYHIFLSLSELDFIPKEVSNFCMDAALIAKYDKYSSEYMPINLEHLKKQWKHLSEIYHFDL